MREQAPAEVLHPAFGGRNPSPWMHDAADAPDASVSSVIGRVKLTLSSSVVQLTPAGIVVTNAEPMAESRSVDARPAWTMPIGL